MSGSFDIQRKTKPRPQVSRPQSSAPVSLPKGKRQGTMGMLFLAIIGVIVISLIFKNPNQQTTADTVTPPPASGPSATPTNILPLPTIVESSSPASLPTVTPVSTAEPKTTPATNATPLPTPSTTQPAELKKSDISMRILNGSGTAGKSNELRKQLEQVGFTVKSIAVAKTTRENTIIYYGKDAKAKADLVAGFIKDREVVFEENPDLTKPDDLLIIVGIK